MTILILFPILVTSVYTICLPDPPFLGQNGGGYYQGANPALYQLYLRPYPYTDGLPFAQNGGLQQAEYFRRLMSSGQVPGVGFPRVGLPMQTGANQGLWGERVNGQRRYPVDIRYNENDKAMLSEEEQERIQKMFHEPKEEVKKTMEQNVMYNKANIENKFAGNINQESVNCKPQAPIFADNLYGTNNLEAFQKIYTPEYLQYLQRLYEYNFLNNQWTLNNHKLNRVENTYGANRWRHLPDIYSTPYITYLQDLHGPDFVGHANIQDQHHQLGLLQRLGNFGKGLWQMLLGPRYNGDNVNQHINGYLDYLRDRYSNWQTQNIQYPSGYYQWVPYPWSYQQGGHEMNTLIPDKHIPKPVDTFDRFNLGDTNETETKENDKVKNENKNESTIVIVETDDSSAKEKEKYKEKEKEKEKEIEKEKEKKVISNEDNDDEYSDEEEEEEYGINFDSRFNKDNPHKKGKPDGGKKHNSIENENVHKEVVNKPGNEIISVESSNKDKAIIEEKIKENKHSEGKDGSKDVQKTNPGDGDHQNIEKESVSTKIQKNSKGDDQPKTGNESVTVEVHESNQGDVDHKGVAKEYVSTEKHESIQGDSDHKNGANEFVSTEKHEIIQKDDDNKNKGNDHVLTEIHETIEGDDAYKNKGGIISRYSTSDKIAETIEGVGAPQQLSLTITIPPATISKTVKIVRPESEEIVTEFDDGEKGNQLKKHGNSKFHATGSPIPKISLYGGSGNRQDNIKIDLSGEGQIDDGGKYEITSNGGPGHSHRTVKHKIIHHSGSGHKGMEKHIGHEGEDQDESWYNITEINESGGDDRHDESGQGQSHVKVKMSEKGTSEGEGQSAITGNGGPAHGHRIVKYKVMHHGGSGRKGDHGTLNGSETEGSVGDQDESWYNITETNEVGSGNLHDGSDHGPNIVKAKMSEEGTSEDVGNYGMSGNSGQKHGHRFVKYKVMHHGGSGRKGNHGTLNGSDHEGAVKDQDESWYNITEINESENGDLHNGSGHGQSNEKIGISGEGYSEGGEKYEMTGTGGPRHGHRTVKYKVMHHGGFGHRGNHGSLRGSGNEKLVDDQNDLWYNMTEINGSAGGNVQDTLGHGENFKIGMFGNDESEGGEKNEMTENGHRMGNGHHMVKYKVIRHGGSVDYEQGGLDDKANMFRYSTEHLQDESGGNYSGMEKNRVGGGSKRWHGSGHKYIHGGVRHGHRPHRYIKGHDHHNKSIHGDNKSGDGIMQAPSNGLNLNSTDDDEYSYETIEDIEDSPGYNLTLDNTTIPVSPLLDMRFNKDDSSENNLSILTNSKSGNDSDHGLTMKNNSKQVNSSMTEGNFMHSNNSNIGEAIQTKDMVKDQIIPGLDKTLKNVSSISWTTSDSGEPSTNPNNKTVVNVPPVSTTKEIETKEISKPDEKVTVVVNNEKLNDVVKPEDKTVEKVVSEAVVAPKV